ncbi:MAG TPA: hypothetical protein EYQ42_00080 [Thiotrichaceae bacterium]|jgi:hypothetical protein|nr:hypothetical protein [Thiotrichaceae bacterium]HIK68235.1 hypothetical protein [Flavobacteriales bacterium]
MSLRKPVNENCKECIYDNLAPGTWLQQVTLCSIKTCRLYKVRPQTKAQIPDNVLSYYQAGKTGASQGISA